MARKTKYPDAEQKIYSAIVAAGEDGISFRRLNEQCRQDDGSEYPRNRIAYVLWALARAKMIECTGRALGAKYIALEKDDAIRQQRRGTIAQNRLEKLEAFFANKILRGEPAEINTIEAVKLWEMKPNQSATTAAGQQLKRFVAAGKLQMKHGKGRGIIFFRSEE